MIIITVVYLFNYGVVTTSMKKSLLVVLLGILLATVSCASAQTEPVRVQEPTIAPTAEVVKDIVTKAPAKVESSGDPVKQGYDIFTGTGGCVACHKIENIPTAIGMVGPELTYIGTDSETRQPGVSAKDYLYESIREPQAFVPEGGERSVPNLMTAAITARLTEDEVNALVAFLLEQK